MYAYPCVRIDAYPYIHVCIHACPVASGSLTLYGCFGRSSAGHISLSLKPLAFMAFEEGYAWKPTYTM